MTWSPDDLASVLVAPDRQFTGFGQGLLLEWDPDTFANRVDYHGTTLTDLPVLSGADALSWQPGDVVLLMRWQPNGRGLASYWLAGRAVTPGSGQGARAVAFLRGQLARQISAEVFTQQIHTATVFAPATRNNTAYGDPDVGDPGPALTDVPVTAAGQAIAIVTAQISVVDNAGRSGFMSVEAAGPSATVAADDGAAVVADIGGTTDGQSIAPRCSALYVFTGLSEGRYTFTAKYRTLTTGGNVTFSNRNLTVIAF